VTGPQIQISELFELIKVRIRKFQVANLIFFENSIYRAVDRKKLNYTTVFITCIDNKRLCNSIFLAACSSVNLIFSLKKIQLARRLFYMEIFWFIEGARQNIGITVWITGSCTESWVLIEGSPPQNTTHLYPFLQGGPRCRTKKKRKTLLFF